MSLAIASAKTKEKSGDTLKFDHRFSHISVKLRKPKKNIKNKIFLVDSDRGYSHACTKRVLKILSQLVK